MIPTPWGPSQSCTDIGRGILSVTTASHGGYFVPRELRSSLPAPKYTPAGWYEEDCEWAHVAIAFPELFPAEAAPVARAIAARYFAEGR